MWSNFKKAVFFLTLLFLVSSTQSCIKRGYGCPGDNASVKTKKDGTLPTKRGRSSLFSKKMRKKLKIH